MLLPFPVSGDYLCFLAYEPFFILIDKHLHHFDYSYADSSASLFHLLRIVITLSLHGCFKGNNLPYLNTLNLITSTMSLLPFKALK